MEKIIVRCKACSHSGLLRSPDVLTKISISTKFRCEKCSKTDIEILVAREWVPEAQVGQAPSVAQSPERLSAEITLLKAEHEQLTAKINELRHEQAILTTQTQQLQAKKVEIEIGVTQLSSQEKQLRSQALELNGFKDKLVAQVSQLTTQAEHFDRQGSILRREIEELRGDLAKVQEGKARLAVEIAQSHQLTAQAEQLERKKIRLTTEIEVLDKKLKQLNDRERFKKQLETELDQLRQQKTKLEADVAGLRRQLRSLNEKDALERGLKQVKDQNAVLEVKVSHLNKELEAAKNQQKPVAPTTRQGGQLPSSDDELSRLLGGS